MMHFQPPSELWLPDRRGESDTLLLLLDCSKLAVHVLELSDVTVKGKPTSGPQIAARVCLATSVKT